MPATVPFAVIDGVPVRVVEMTGGPGDAVLWHPALYHSRSFNCLGAEVHANIIPVGTFSVGCIRS